jgi:hypothetical protein
MKGSITKVAVINSDTVKISTGSCLGSSSFHYQDVSSPVFLSASELANQISYWIYVIEFPPGPSE